MQESTDMGGDLRWKWHKIRRCQLYSSNKWISVCWDLKCDAQRDLDDVGAPYIEVHTLNKQSYTKPDLGVREGAIFLIYNSLTSVSERDRARWEKLLQWCGSDFEGLVVFDECHKAKNLIPKAGTQPTGTGKAVVELQERLPKARIVYCSATGASEPRNLGYMVRLGLWGSGTCFLDFREFLGALQKGGVGALELVAMDLKARGAFVCRTLSYKGAEFEIIETSLKAIMLDMYKEAAEFWAELRVELLSADEKFNSRKLWLLYWATHQRFFRHMCMSAKVPYVIKLSKKALEENKSVVIGLQTTGEAPTEEAVTKYGAEQDDFISAPRELLLKFVENNYPLPPRPAYLDDLWKSYEAAVERKSKILERIRSLNLPNNPLDDIIDQVVIYNAFLSCKHAKLIPRSSCLPFFKAVIHVLEDAQELIDNAIYTAFKESKPAYISISCNCTAIPPQDVLDLGFHFPC